MYEITMPKLSDSMQEGKIIEWKVKEGDAVREGDVLAEVESDKAMMELECFHTGKLAKIVRGNDSEVKVGEVIGLIAAEGEAPQPAETKEEAGSAEGPGEAVKGARESAGKKDRAEREGRKPPESPRPHGEPPKPAAEPPARPAPAEGARQAASPYARRLAQEKGIDLSRVSGSGPGGRITAADIERAIASPAPAKEKAGKPPSQPARAPEPPKAPEAKRDADPLARVAAEKRGIDLSAVTGTGAGGRITVDDVLAHRAPGRPPADASARPAPDEELPPIDLREGEAEVEDAPYRLKTAARRVVASKHVIPHFYITRSVDVTALMARKDELKQKLGATVTHVILLACLRALHRRPEINRTYDRGKIIKWKGIHLGLAVDTPEGLTVVVLRDAQELSLKEIVARTQPLVDRARAGKLSAEDRRHPTFTVSSLGMFDVEQFEAIINPPSAVTLAVAAALPAPVVRGDKLEVGRKMNLTLSCDHRIIDGALAAKFIAELKTVLEDVKGLLKGA